MDEVLVKEQGKTELKMINLFQNKEKFLEKNIVRPKKT
jgi:hypothetical protein